jgi:beta-N-acetylhexosaminidase
LSSSGPELERLAAATLFPSFDGLSAPGWVLSWLERGLGGVVLFARNVSSRPQLRELCESLGEAVVAIDEEGGDVTRLERAEGSSYPGNGALGAVDDVALTAQVAAALGGDLARCGVNLDLAPVADLATDPLSPIVGVRSFGSSPELAARHVAAFVRGLQCAGVAACAKHWPGHGDTHEDSHLALPTVRVSRETLLSRELVPFRAAVEAGVASMMTAHIRVPALDGDRAAPVSPVVLGLLREELGFDGVVITDALEMQGLAASVGVEEGAVQALAAGADALCIGAELYEDALASIHARIVAAVREGRLAEERLAKAAARVQRLAAAYPRRTGETLRPDPVGLEAARRALRAEGEFELARKPLVIELVAEPSIPAGPAGRGLGFELDTDVVRLADVPRGGTELFLRPDRQVVLVLHDAHRHEWQRKAAELLIGLAPNAIAVETGLPLWQAPARGRLATYGQARVNLEAAAERLLGKPA